MTQKLKRKISERWEVLVAGRAQLDATQAAALAQLEYILQEAGLLVQHRRRNASEQLDDNTMSLSEVVGKNSQ
jgi:hypothetical protein